MAVAADKNLVDRDEYPQTPQLEDRCLDIIADFWNVPEPDNPVGCSTIGSSEACMLGGLALRWRWKERQKDAGRPSDRPILGVVGILGSTFDGAYEDIAGMAKALDG